MKYYKQDNIYNIKVTNISNIKVTCQILKLIIKNNFNINKDADFTLLKKFNVSRIYNIYI